MGGNLKNLTACVFVFGAFINFTVHAQEGAEPPPASRQVESELPLDVPEGAGQEADRAGTLRDAERSSLLGEGTIGGNGVFAVFQVLIVLVLVALAIYGVVFVLKKGNKHTDPSNGQLKLLAAIPLGMKASAVVIAVGSKAWLAGVSETSVSLLAELSDQETVDMMLLDYARNSTAASTGKAASFLGLIQRFLPQTHNKNETGKERPIDSALLDQLRGKRDRLRGL
ncbi:MAG: flagellar biosynthetic protein FliO [Spirochaetaceae bacterium]|nr:flagellar biosynthetic protein FliO [Spirochaetaceae bacterium]